MTESSQYSLLQWLGPELVREGLLRNEDWVTEHTNRAAALFDPKTRLSTVAVMMAAIDPRSIDYIEQAPVLVAGTTAGLLCERPKERLYVARLWQGKIASGPKLRDLLKLYGFTQQHREIKGKALRAGPTYLTTLRQLSSIPASTLAQAIPPAIRKQVNWIEELTSWQKSAATRFNDRSLFFDWAAVALSVEAGRRLPAGTAASVVDFAGATASSFNVKWSWQQAEARKNRWHEELAKASEEQSFFLRYNIGWEEPIDYGKLPPRADIDGFEIVALQTGASLFSEGRVMRHCVASYSKAVITGKSFIYSVRLGERRHATFELIPSTWKPPLYVLQQLKGPRNSTVHPSIRAAVYKFRDQCNRISPDEVDPELRIDLPSCRCLPGVLEL